MTLIFVNPAFSGIYTTAGQLYWQLPQTSKDVGHPLALKSDMDKLVIAYDTNRIVIYDTINRKLHQWSLDHMNKMP